MIERDDYDRDLALERAQEYLDACKDESWRELLAGTPTEELENLVEGIQDELAQREMQAQKEEIMCDFDRLISLFTGRF